MKKKNYIRTYILTYLAIFDTEFHSKHIIDRKKNEGSPTIYISNHVSVCFKTVLIRESNVSRTVFFAYSLLILVYYIL